MKVKELQAILQKKRVDCALFYCVDFENVEKNIIYFSCYGGMGALVIPKNKKPFLVVPKMEEVKARDSNIKVVVWDKEKRLFAQIKCILRKQGVKIKKIGIDKTAVALTGYTELKKQFKAHFVDIFKECSALRTIKTQEEISIIQRGCKISDEIIGACIERFTKFKTETEVKAFLEYEANKRGCGLAFPTIVASGRNAAKPHHVSQNATLQKGFCVIDFGIRYKNYCTDTTRTIYLGKISESERKLYEFVLGVQEKLLREARAGKKCSELYNNAKRMLGKYAPYFTHGLGHGFGIKIHELPNLTDKSKEALREGMVVTIEPGIYLNNQGIIIEDDILIQKDPLLLTTYPKKLQVIP